MLSDKRYAGFLLLVLTLSCKHTAPSRGNLAGSDSNGDSKIALLKACSSDSKTGDKCAISPNAIHPTQFALGLANVKIKQKQIAVIKSSPEKLAKYVAENTVPAVKGPKNIFYIVDGHHRTRAMAEEHLPYMYIEIIKNNSELTLSEFWHKMEDDKYYWLFDEKGKGPLKPEQVPDNIMNLKDDPYRTLAEDVENTGAIKTTKTLYQQFIWANYFRIHIPKSTVLNKYQDALKDAIIYAHHPGAKDLPGFVPDQN